MRLRTKLAAAVMAGAASVTMVAGVPALASSQASASTAVTGPETMTGAVHGKEALLDSPIVPLQWRGVVNTHSVINLGGLIPTEGSVSTFRSAAGKLVITVTNKPQVSDVFNDKTCRLTFIEDLALTVVGGKSTGAFAGASGPGAVRLFLTSIGPRFKSGPQKGQCNEMGQPGPKGAVVSFLASLVLTVK